MNSDPTQQQARGALTEAANQASRIRGSDRQFRTVLIGIAAIYLMLGILVGLPREWRSGFEGIAVLVIFLGGMAGSLLLIWRIRAYSRIAMRRFILSCAAFTLWNVIVAQVSVATGWWARNQPSSHFTVSAVVASVPLLVAAWMMGSSRE